MITYLYLDAHIFLTCIKSNELTKKIAKKKWRPESTKKNGRTQKSIIVEQLKHKKMKILVTIFGVILVASLFLGSCGQNNSKQKELELRERELALKEKELQLKSDSILRSNKESKEEAKKLPDIGGSDEPQMEPIQVELYPFKGTIGSNEIVLTFEVPNKFWNNYEGTYYYTKYNKTIEFSGSIEDNAKLIESVDGKETGYFVFNNLDVFAEKIIGKWYSVDEKKSYDVVLTKN